MTKPPTPLNLSYSIEVASASPTTPSIVISRPATPDLPSRFVDISLGSNTSPPRSGIGSRGSSIPRRIIVPITQTPPDVELVQGPPTPSPSSRGRESYDYSATSSSRPSRDDSDSGGEERDISTHIPPTPSSPLPTPTGPPVYPLSAAAFKKAQNDRKRKSGGISTQDVVSKTRPTHLPPKSKQEDLKHMQSWEEMMQRSRLAGLSIIQLASSPFVLTLVRDFDHR